MMTKLEQLYEEQSRLNSQKVTGSASAMEKHQRKSNLQKEIDYYELGDNISRKHIQEELAEIETMQEEVNRLTAVVADKKRKLMENVFGAHAVI